MRLEDLKGRRLGRYEIVDVLGRGGMAAVYRAHDTVLRRDVALKILYPQFADDTALVERFQREAVLAASLDHPHILPIYDVGETDGLVYIAMKLLSGRSFADELRVRRALPLRDLVPIVEQVASALDYAHARRIVHRDIKPANIMLEQPPQHDAPARAILTDFGIAKSLDPAATGLTTSGVLIGTPEYMAPEQIRGGQDVDPRADIYALGVLVYRALTGRRPFEGGTQEVLIGHLQGQITDPSLIEPALPPAIDPIIRRALERDPRQRYDSAGAFARALSTVAGMAPPTPPPALRREADGRAVVPRVAVDDMTQQQLDRSHDVTRKGTAVPPARPLPPRVSAPAYQERRAGTGWAILAVLLVFAVGGGLLFGRSLLAGNAGGGAAIANTAQPTATEPAIAAPPPTVQPTATLETSAPTATSNDAQPTVVPAATAQPTAQPTARPTSPPTSTPTPTPTSIPTLAPTNTPTPTPTSTPTPTPCPVALTGGFGMLLNQNPAIRQRLGCPTEVEAGGRSTIAEQRFERGSMFYYQPLEHIYALIGVNEGTWRLFERGELVSLPSPTPAPSPPCAAPLVGGFGLVWGSFASIRDALGCSTQPEGGLFEGAFQPFENGTLLYSSEGLGRGKTIYVLFADKTFERHDDPNQ